MRDARAITVALGLLAILWLSMISGFVPSPAAAVQSGAMSFGVMDPRASYGIPSYNNQQVQDADLGMLISTVAFCIKNKEGYEP
jgi:hypothetical protein